MFQGAYIWIPLSWAVGTRLSMTVCKHISLTSGHQMEEHGEGCSLGPALHRLLCLVKQGGLQPARETKR